MHDQLAIHEVEAVGLGLERMLNHIVYCSHQHTDESKSQTVLL